MGGLRPPRLSHLGGNEITYNVGCRIWEDTIARVILSTLTPVAAMKYWCSKVVNYSSTHPLTSFSLAYPLPRSVQKVHNSGVIGGGLAGPALDGPFFGSRLRWTT